MLILFVLSSNVAFANQINSETKFKKLKISSISITANGAWTDNISGNETPEMCKSFLLSEHDVKLFFEKSNQVTERAYGHDFPAAMCYGEGLIKFKNGHTGTWKIDQARRGLLKLSNDKVFYFYCKKCSSTIFMDR